MRLAFARPELRSSVTDNRRGLIRMTRTHVELEFIDGLGSLSHIT